MSYNTPQFLKPNIMDLCECSILNHKINNLFNSIINNDEVKNNLSSQYLPRTVSLSHEELSKKSRRQPQSSHPPPPPPLHKYQSIISKLNELVELYNKYIDNVNKNIVNILKNDENKLSSIIIPTDININKNEVYIEDRVIKLIEQISEYIKIITQNINETHAKLMELNQSL